MKKYIQKLLCLMVLVLELGAGISARPLVDIGGEGYDDPGLMTNEDARYLEDRTIRQDTITHVPKRYKQQDKDQDQEKRKNRRQMRRDKRHARRYKNKQNKQEEPKKRSHKRSKASDKERD